MARYIDPLTGKNINQEEYSTAQRVMAKQGKEIALAQAAEEREKKAAFAKLVEILSKQGLSQKELGLIFGVGEEWLNADPAKKS